MTALTGKHRRAAGPSAPLRAVLAAALALALAAPALAALASPTPALAVETSKENFEEKYKDDYHQAIKDRKEDPSKNTNTMWTDDDLMMGACGEYPGFDAVNAGPWVSYFVYSTAEGIASFCVDCGEAMLQCISSSGLLKLDFTGKGSDFAKMYSAAADVSVKVIQPICVGFLGLACVWALLEFSKEVSTNRGDHFSMAGNYVWIIVKFSLVMVLISHTVQLCGGVYEVFLWVANKVSDTLAAGQISGVGFNSFMLSMMEIRYSQFAWSIGYALVALVILVSTGLCLIKVLTLTITRMFEIYLMTAFAGFPLVMLTTRETRPSGVGYFKKFAGVCLQAAILITIIAFAGICFSAAGSLLATKPNPGIDDAVWTIISLLASMAGCFGFSALCGQSKHIADTIMGAMG